MLGTNTKHHPRPGIEIIALAAVVVLGAFALLSRPQPGSAVIGAYATSLTDRTPHQRYNARRAAAAVDGYVIEPGKTFSFDDTVRAWTGDRGFLKAPVSYNGILIDDYGGGVCETSTTLYNAALLAGLTIVERHAHSFSPSYAPPGRDAAVAYHTADLRIENDTRAPVTIRIRADSSRIVCRLLSPKTPKDRVDVTAKVLDRRPAQAMPSGIGLPEQHPGLHRSRWEVRGRDGLRVEVFRTWYRGGEPSTTQLVSDDTYLPISRYAW